MALGLTLSVLLWRTFQGAGELLENSSDQLRAAISTRIGERVSAFLSRAPAVAWQIQLALNRGLVDPRDRDALEAVLLAPLLADENLGEVTLTYAESAGFSPDGSFVRSPGPRGQIAALRVSRPDGGEEFLCREVYSGSDGFSSRERKIERGSFTTDRFSVLEIRAVADPTEHPTFLTPAREDLYGRLIWSDLHWSQLDENLPTGRRRVEASVQQVMTDPEGRFVGVLRVGLLVDRLQRAVQLDATDGPHSALLCDSAGRLITRGVGSDPLREDGDDLRIDPAVLPPFLRSALSSPGPARAAHQDEAASERIVSEGSAFLATFQRLPAGASQDWLIGVVVPSAYYLEPLAAPRTRMLITAGAVVCGVLVASALVARSIQRGHASVVIQAERMNALRFEPAGASSPFRDVSAVLESLERAKTAVRAMSRYVPVDLVRRLYRMGREPIPGGTLTEVSLMFTDIAGFTSITESLPPARLAEALQLYLDALTSVIQRETGGTIDKYIGDAIMTFWNAPEPCPDYAQRACNAALRCRAAEEALMANETWQGLPPFRTRFGLHCGPVIVGHFGGSERLNYTAIGDTVNLAARLEGLNKFYGTTIIASEAIVSAAGSAFVFRQLDIVAAKGKQQATRIYELLGPATTPRTEVVERYERAFELYQRRLFSEAIPCLVANGADAPSAVLLARCRRYLGEAPPDDWNGTYIAHEK